MPTRNSEKRQAARITVEEAEQHFLFIEKTMYQAVWFVVPLIAVLALAAGHHFNLLDQTYMVSVGGLLLVNVALLLNYRFRGRSLSSFTTFLLVPICSMMGTLAAIMFIDMTFGDPARVSAGLLRRYMITIEIVLLVVFAVGSTWSFYGNRRSVRRAELVAAFKQHVLTMAQVSMLVFFPQGKRPWGAAHWAIIGTVFASVVLAMRFGNVARWYDLVPFVTFVILASSTVLFMGMMFGFYMALRPLFRAYGDIEIRR